MSRYCQVGSKQVEHCTYKWKLDRYDPERKGRILVEDHCGPRTISHYICVEDDGATMERLQALWTKAAGIWGASPTDGSEREFNSNAVVSYGVSGDRVLNRSANTYIRNGRECGFFGFLTGYCNCY